MVSRRSGLRFLTDLAGGYSFTVAAGPAMSQRLTNGFVANRAVLGFFAGGIHPAMSQGGDGNGTGVLTIFAGVGLDTHCAAGRLPGDLSVIPVMARGVKHDLGLQDLAAGIALTALTQSALDAGGRNAGQVFWVMDSTKFSSADITDIIGILIGMSQSGDSILRQQDLLAYGAMAAGAQTGLGAGGCLLRIVHGRVIQRTSLCLSAGGAGFRFFAGSILPAMAGGGDGFVFFFPAVLTGESLLTGFRASGGGGHFAFVPTVTGGRNGSIGMLLTTGAGRGFFTGLGAGGRLGDLTLVPGVTQGGDGFCFDF